MLTETSLRLRRDPEVHIVRGGSGPPPLVWLHGMAAPTPDDAVLNALAARHEVIAPMMPGLASLEALAELPTLHDLVLFYDAILAELGIVDAVLVGHGFGAMLAAELAALSPGRFGWLVLAGPLGLWNDAHPVADIFANRFPDVDALIWAGCRTRPKLEQSQDDEIEAQIRFANALGAMANYTWPIPERGLRRRLYRIDIPTLVLAAKADAWIPPAYAADLAALIEGARTGELDGSHMAPYEDPPGFAGLIEGFIGDGGS
jgi:pimeloyl-ACP methyl ester carboxylesterase